MATVMITGANRGIGLEFVQQYLAAGDRVVAACRNPAKAEQLHALAQDRLQLIALDVTDSAGIRAAAAEVDEPIDILINNAGVYGPRNPQLGELDYDAWMEVLNANTLGPLRVAEAFLGHVARSQRKVIATITSKMGSIADNTSGGSYLYRSSKAALNAAHKSLALDTQHKGMISVVLHPGWVITDMGGPNALITTEQSVTSMRAKLAALSAQDNGGFFNYDGKPIPW